MARFTGKVAIVTGASHNLGLQMAQMMAAEGARVVLAARRFEMVEQHAKDIGKDAIAIRCDVTKEEDIAAMVEAAMSAWGQVDILMNNAAQPGTDLYLWDQTLENWNNTIAVDCTAAMLGAREVVRRSMKERRSGVILNFSSVTGWNGHVRKTHYTVAKAGLRALTKVIALEMGPYNVRCNCVVPGPIDNDLFAAYIKREAEREGITFEEKRAQTFAWSPLNTMSNNEDVANMALFLASDQARTITGQSVNVDGGMVMNG